MSDLVEELLNVYDAAGGVVGSMARGEAKTRGFPVGAVQLLVVNSRGQVLLQRRREDKENGGLWDKSVGGHVLAGESFDRAIVREGNEELFGTVSADRIELVDSFEGRETPAGSVTVRRVRVELGLRDIRFASTPERRLINVTYHAAMYAGRTDLPTEGFAPQVEELAGLRYFEPRDVDRMLVDGELAPNMAFLWFALGGTLFRT